MQSYAFSLIFHYLCTKFFRQMKKLTIFFILCFCIVTLTDVSGQRSRTKYRRTKYRTHKTIRRKAVSKPAPPPTMHDENPFLQCEDTCDHVHGIDLSHYQGQVFWESVGMNTKMQYVYLKATEGSDRIDSHFERNIDLAHRYGLKVGSYHFFRPKTNLTVQLENFKAQCLPGEQDLIPMIDIETVGGLSDEAFCDSLLKFISLVETAYKQKPLLYTYRNFYNQHMLGKVDDYQLMIAMYTNDEPVLADGRDYTMWQYSCKGRIAGVSSYVDKSRFVGNHGLREIRFKH